MQSTMSEKNKTEKKTLKELDVQFFRVDIHW